MLLVTFWHNLFDNFMLTFTVLFGSLESCKTENIRKTVIYSKNTKRLGYKYILPNSNYLGFLVLFWVLSVNKSYKLNFEKK